MVRRLIMETSVWLSRANGAGPVDLRVGSVLSNYAMEINDLIAGLFPCDRFLWNLF